MNVLIFLTTNMGGYEQLEETAYRWGVVPTSLLRGETKIEQPAPWLTLFTSMFMHGGWFHLIFNMLALWIFGDNVEDRLGSLRFFIFYIMCGLCADFAHILLNNSSSVPALGASGAIAGVMGAYIVLFPDAKVRTLIIFFPYIRTVSLTAFFYLIVWFSLQLLNQVLSWGLNQGLLSERI